MFLYNMYTYFCLYNLRSEEQEGIAENKAKMFNKSDFDFKKDKAESDYIVPLTYGAISGRFARKNN